MTFLRLPWLLSVEAGLESSFLVIHTLFLFYYSDLWESLTFLGLNLLLSHPCSSDRITYFIKAFFAIPVNFLVIQLSAIHQ
jgi:hypothetical protein